MDAAEVVLINLICWVSLQCVGRVPNRQFKMAEAAGLHPPFKLHPNMIYRIFYSIGFLLGD
jgi:hypothetical protein